MRQGERNDTLASAQGHQEKGGKAGVLVVRVEAVERVDSIRRAIGRSGRAPMNLFVELKVEGTMAKGKYRTYATYVGFKDTLARFLEPAGATFRLPVESRETRIRVTLGEGEKKIWAGAFASSFRAAAAIDADGGGPVSVVSADGHVRMQVKFEPGQGWVRQIPPKTLTSLRVAGIRGGQGLALRPPFSPSVYEYKVVVPRLLRGGAPTVKGHFVEDGADQCFVTATTAPGYGAAGENVVLSVNDKRWASGQEVACPMGEIIIRVDGAEMQYRVTAARPEPPLSEDDISPQLAAVAPPAEERDVLVGGSVEGEPGGEGSSKSGRDRSGRAVRRWLDKHPTIVHAATAAGLGLCLWYL